MLWLLDQCLLFQEEVWFEYELVVEVVKVICDMVVCGVLVIGISVVYGIVFGVCVCLVQGGDWCVVLEEDFCLLVDL